MEKGRGEVGSGARGARFGDVVDGGAPERGLAEVFDVVVFGLEASFCGE